MTFPRLGRNAGVPTKLKIKYNAYAKFGEQTKCLRGGGGVCGRGEAEGGIGGIWVGGLWKTVRTSGTILAKPLEVQ